MGKQLKLGDRERFGSHENLTTKMQSTLSELARNIKRDLAMRSQFKIFRSPAADP
jgi:hypothetical protein